MKASEIELIKKSIEERHDLINRLRNGEKVVCSQCGKGFYECSGPPSKANYFHCNNCDNFLHITPGYPIVE